jgi:GT2 family glycosyltransferase/2-polyprenyl-3-methyl-5-hydroxy-6-metoxy-1,4-benzoquinol methylase
MSVEAYKEFFGTDINTRDGKILHYIRSNSTVLEFGPGYGRMTKFMKEILGCKVYIIEKDVQAYEYAMQFAAGGICDDILNLSWMKTLKKINFDHIIFANVLEYMPEPGEILERSLSLLKNDGSVFLSVPNLAHSAVIIDLINNKFEYRAIGLLDKTYKKFFTYSSLVEMLEDCSLVPVVQDGTICVPENTEFKASYSDLPENSEVIRYKKYADVYQFVFKCIRRKYYTENKDTNQIQKLCDYIPPRPTTSCTVYLDTGAGFNAEESMNVSLYRIKDHFEATVGLASGVRGIRFDPFEGYACIIRNLDIITDSGTIEHTYTNGIEVNDIFVFDTLDPQIAIDFGQRNVYRLKISGEIYQFDIDKVIFLSKFKRVIEEYNKAKSTMQELTVERDMLVAERDGLVAERNMLVAERDGLAVEKETLAAERNMLVAERDYLITEQNGLFNSRSWRITKPLREITAFIRNNRVLYLFAKGLLFIKRNGIKETLKKIVAYRKRKLGVQPTVSFVSSANLTKSERLRQKNEKFSKQIKISIITPLYNTPERFLRQMIESVLVQTYDNWELCLADGSDNEHEDVKRICKDYAEKEKRIKYRKLEENHGISGNSNEAIDMSTGDYIALCDHDDMLLPNALYENAVAIQETNADVIYSDEEFTDVKGKKHFYPFYKPDWSRDLLYTQMYICHLLVIKKEMLDKVGRFNSEFDGSQDYDLMLRLSEQTESICHIPKLLYSWRAIPTSTSINSDSKSYAQEAGLNALNAHLLRRYNNMAYALPSSDMFVYDTRFNTMQDKPMVSIIIPMRDKAELTDRCIQSIINKSTYENYEIIILDNNSSEQITFEWFKKIENQESRINITKADFEFNWSKINNFGIKQANGNVFIFLNNDTTIITEDWIERLCENALRDDIGTVGPLLLYDDGTIQHAGLVVGMNGWTDHVFKGMPPVNSRSPYVSPTINRNVLAVTGACMCVSRKTIEKIGLFDENFVICGSDVEFCIRAYEAGLSNMYNANVRLYHLESKTRDSFIPKIDFQMSYKAYTPYRENGDPYFNPNLDINSVIPSVNHG